MEILYKRELITFQLKQAGNKRQNRSRKRDKTKRGDKINLTQLNGKTRQPREQDTERRDRHGDNTGETKAIPKDN